MDFSFGEYSILHVLDFASIVDVKAKLLSHHSQKMQINILAFKD
jgi:hypothetical protein